MKNFNFSILFISVTLFFCSCGGSKDAKEQNENAVDLVEYGKKQASITCELKDLVNDPSKNKDKIKSLFEERHELLMKSFEYNNSVGKEKAEENDMTMKNEYIKALEDCGLTESTANELNYKVRTIAKQ